MKEKQEAVEEAEFDLGIIVSYPEFMNHFPEKHLNCLAEGVRQAHLRWMAAEEVERRFYDLLLPVPFSQLDPVPTSCGINFNALRGRKGK